MEIKKYQILLSDKDKFINLPLDLSTKPVDNYEKVEEFINNETKRAINPIEPEEKEQYSPFKMDVWNYTVTKTQGYPIHISVIIDNKAYSRSFYGIDSAFVVTTGICSMISAVTKAEVISATNFRIKDFYTDVKALSINVVPGKAGDNVKLTTKNIETFSYDFEFKFFNQWFGGNPKSVTGYDQKYYNTSWEWAGYPTWEGDVFKKNTFKKSKFLLEFFDTNDTKNNTRIGYITLPVNQLASIVTSSNPSNLGYYFYFNRDINKIPNSGLDIYMRGAFLNARTGNVQRFMNVKHDFPKLYNNKIYLTNVLYNYGQIGFETASPHNFNVGEFVLITESDQQFNDTFQIISAPSNNVIFVNKIGGPNNKIKVALPNQSRIQRCDFLTAEDYNDSFQYFKVKIFKNLTYKIYGDDNLPLEKVTLREIYFT